MRFFPRRSGRRTLTLTAALLLLGVSAARAQLISVNWNPDGSTDGAAAGTLGTLGVVFTSTNGANNGGITFGTNWPANLGANDVPGINSPGIVNEGVALDWNAGATGFATVAFTGGTVTDPILLFNFLDVVVQTFDFDDGLSLTLLDQNPAGSVSIAAGNVVTTTGVHANSANDGFAVQVLGTFSSLTFATNVNQARGDSVGFTVVGPAPAAPGAVPEPGTFALLAGGLLPLVGALRRLKAG